ncbi:hypothetical protein ASG82_00825 [Mycobacterium sp. Soil538]|nr:hypothetical protein ASG82_00825 [Mycobacterium sp. Soil538]
MRTAVVRIGVDPTGKLSADQLRAGMTELSGLAAGLGARVVDGGDLASLPAQRREVEILMAGTDAAELQEVGVALCARAFATRPVAGVLTFVSRGTDEDAYGVLAGFGLTGMIERTPGSDGWDIIIVTLRKADLRRIPESRIHTALEAATNCEVRIVATE